MPDPTNELSRLPRNGLAPDPNGSEKDQTLGTGSDPQAGRKSVHPKWRGFYDQLVATRDGLIDTEVELGARAREIDTSYVAKETADVATDEFQRDQLLANRSLDQEILEEVDAAISRIEDGSCGICEATGRPIPEERLKAVPWTRFTVEAQAALEQAGRSGNPAIGALGSVREREASRGL